MTVTLADIERAVAPRVGPYYQTILDRQSPSTANFNTVLVPSLRSSIEQDLVTNLWLLRRGIDWQGNPVTVESFDRQRLVAFYDPERGEVTVERPYSAAPAVGEVVEFYHLDPTLELREAVRAGLRRCFFEDRFSLGTGFIFEADLTAALPWLTDQKSIGRVQAAPFPSGFFGNSCDIPFDVFGQSGHVCIRLNRSGSGPFFGGVLLTLYRPHFSWVNRTDTLDGPMTDADELDVDLDYAASAAHIEAWHLFPAKLMAAAAGGLQATQAMAAQEFTRQSMHWFPPSRQTIALPDLFGHGRGMSLVINA
jgi:hypothetical protein